MTGLFNFNRFSAFVLLGVLIGAPALAVTPAHWVQDSEAEFNAGKLENVVVTNLGDLKLSRAVHTILEQNPQVSAVYALIQAPDGSIYAATGPRGVLLHVVNGKAQPVVVLEQATNLTALALTHDGKLLIGTSGKEGRIYRLDDLQKPPTLIFSQQDVQYIWAITVTPDGLIYAATGPDGKLFEVKPDGTHRQVLDTDERNLLAMTSDGKDTLYLGTHPNGLVYKVNRKTGEAFVLYDAPESEISSLVIDAQGNVYAGTAETREQAEQVATEVSSVQVGRPEADSAAPIPSKPPEAPTPPPAPAPNPGEPQPIPKSNPTQVDPVDADPEHTPPAEPVVRTSSTSAAGAQPARSSSDEPTAGNAIYRINPQGFVTEVFRQPVTVLSLLQQDGVLLVGTGDQGAVYQVNPATEETAIIARVDPKQVTAMMRDKDGTIHLGLSNEGGLASMSGGYARRGIYTSAVLDATQISLFGKLHLRGTLPQGSKLSVQTRSGNLEEPSDRGWSPWADPMQAVAFIKIPSPSARFFQFRLIFESEAGQVTPVVDRVDSSYQIPNLSPRVAAIVSAPADASGAAIAETALFDEQGNAKPPTGQRLVAWQANDPNGDKLLYALYFRRGAQGPWILLKDRLVETSYVWPTRQVADGLYDLKVVASDALSNEPGTGRESARISNPIQVDNTPPVIGDMKWQKQPRAVKMSFRVTDQTSIVGSISYTIDAANHWQTVLPVDKIADSPDETVEFVIGDLTPGVHQVTIRALDAHGNASYETLIVTAEK